MLEIKLQEYENMFGDSFPTYPLMFSRTEEEIIKLIDHCLNSKKDVYELGYLIDDPDVIY